MHTKSSVLLIGSGRLAQHLQYWNESLSEPNTLFSWDRSQDPHLLKTLINKVQIVWLAISDSALIPFYEYHLEGHDIKVVHFSGALNDDRLISTHPLMSFPHQLFAPEVYTRIHFVINGCENLSQALPNFKNTFSHLEASEKSFYHALCVVSGNFPQMLWTQVAKEFQDLNIPTEGLDLYIKQICENYLSLKEKAITGPLIRKDSITIQKNISSLDRNEKLKNIYQVFNKEFNP